jgi:enoyl-CoA hydratase
VAAVHSTTTGHVVTLTIAGDSERNLVTAELTQQLGGQLVRFDQDPTMRVCIIRGAGERHFCGGGADDRTQAAARVFRAGPPVRVSGRGVDPDVLRAQKPVIAAVVGECFDEGLVLLGRATDIRIAGASARFGFPGIRSGNAGDLAVRSHLDHQIPFTALRWMIVVGQELDAAEALRVGLVNEVVPDSDVMARAHEIAGNIAELAPLALRGEKQTIQATEGVPMLDGFLYAAAVGLINRLGPDVVEGVAAFNEKRKPEFHGTA